MIIILFILKVKLILFIYVLNRVYAIIKAVGSYVVISNKRHCFRAVQLDYRNMIFIPVNM
jgi:hypothetical protein